MRYKLFQIQPYQYQHAIIQSCLTSNSHILICAGRQVGKSTILSLTAVIYALKHPNSLILILSPSLRQSLLLYQKVVKHVSGLHFMIKKLKMQEMQFKNGSKIISLPQGNGDKIRGFSPNLVLIDEANYVEHDIIMSVVLPSISSTKGRIIMASTPSSKNHIFYDIFTSHPNNWQVFHITSSQNPSISESYLNEMRQMMPKWLYDQEFNALYTTADFSLISYDLSEQVITKNVGSYVYYVDVGGKSNKLAIIKAGNDGGLLYVLDARLESLDSYVEIEDMLEPNSSVVIDATGVGGAVADYLVRKGYKITRIIWSKQNKESAERKLVEMLHQRKICFAKPFKNLFDQIYNTKIIGGRMVIKGEDDLVEALLLAMEEKVFYWEV